MGGWVILVRKEKGKYDLSTVGHHEPVTVRPPKVSCTKYVEPELSFIYKFLFRSRILEE